MEIKEIEAEIAKLMAESAKLNAEKKWYPFLLIAGISSTVSAVLTAILVKFL